MPDRDLLFDFLEPMKTAGFLLEKEQKSHMQKNKGWELKYIHPKLVKKLRNEGYKVRGEKFYIKSLSDEPKSEIGLVNGKLTPLKEDIFSSPPNSHDSFDGSPAWSNRKGDQAYLNQPVGM
jgi:hypothetical protein